VSIRFLAKGDFYRIVGGIHAAVEDGTPDVPGHDDHGMVSAEIAF